MRFLYLCTDAYGGHGGIALYNREFLAALSSWDRCDEVVVVPRLGQVDGTEPSNVKVRIEASGGKVDFVRTVAREIGRNTYDVVFCAHLNLLPVAALAALRSKHPAALIIFGIEAWERPRNPLTAALAGRAGPVISISDVTLSRFSAWSGSAGSSFLLPNPIRVDRYVHNGRDARLVETWGVGDRKVILTVGRLASSERYKGMDEVLEVLPLLPRDIVYVIAGDGSDRQRLELKADALGVRDRVIITGRFDESLKPAIYGSADLYVMPSRGEGFGFVFLEALASGLPVIGSTADGSREALLDGRMGTLVDPGNREELHAAILAALNQPRRIPPELEQFSFTSFESRLHEILDATFPRACTRSSENPPAGS